MNTIEAIAVAIMQGATELFALRAAVYRQTRQHQDGNRIRHVAPEGSRGFTMRDGARRQSVVAHDTLAIINHNESATGSA